MSELSQKLRRLPKIDDLLRTDAVRAIEAPRWAVVETLRSMVEERRQEIRDGRELDSELSIAEVSERVAQRLRPSLRRVINATGVVLHTNLGRAPLSRRAVDRIAELAGGYTNLEYDVAQGQRGSRHHHATELLCRLTGAEDAVVVNNNASAVLLGLAAMAAGREVVVSRGELVEIGGSFRIPDVMRLSGAHLVEVGTTNKTHARDYQQAIGERTALLLKVHKSNFAVVGFTAEVESAELVEIARTHGVASMVDLGSGAVVEAGDLAAWGLPPEPSVREVVASGVDLVTFSGDKLLGGPQAGLVVGRAETIARVRSHPLMRALRPDKLTLLALTATLEDYRDGLREQVPTIAMLSADTASLHTRAQAALERAPRFDHFEIEVVECESTVGGGAMPLARLPSAALAVQAAPNRLDEHLRAQDPAIVGRIVEERLLLDLRTMTDDDVTDVLLALQRIDGIWTK